MSKPASDAAHQAERPAFSLAELLVVVTVICIVVVLSLPGTDQLAQAELLAAAQIFESDLAALQHLAESAPPGVFYAIYIPDPGAVTSIVRPDMYRAVACAHSAPPTALPGGLPLAGLLKSHADVLSAAACSQFAFGEEPAPEPDVAGSIVLKSNQNRGLFYLLSITQSTDYSQQDPNSGNADAVLFHDLFNNDCLQNQARVDLGTYLTYVITEENTGDDRELQVNLEMEDAEISGQRGYCCVPGESTVQQDVDYSVCIGLCGIWSLSSPPGGCPRSIVPHVPPDADTVRSYEKPSSADSSMAPSLPASPIDEVSSDYLDERLGGLGEPYTFVRITNEGLPQVERIGNALSRYHDRLAVEVVSDQPVLYVGSSGLSAPLQVRFLQGPMTLEAELDGYRLRGLTWRMAEENAAPADDPEPPGEQGTVPESELGK